MLKKNKKLLIIYLIFRQTIERLDFEKVNE